MITALVGGTIQTITHGVLEGGAVLVEDGKILAAGRELEIPADAQVIDTTGCWVTPGLIDCHTHLCLMSEPKTMPSIPSETNEKSGPITPYLRASDALNPFDYAVSKVREAGFTTVYTGPGSCNLIGGMGVSCKLRGLTADEMAIPGSEQMKFALGENPKRIYGMEGKSPVTRMGSAGLIRKTLFEARQYSDALLRSECGTGAPPPFDYNLHHLVPVVRGEMKVRIHCHRADDIATALRLVDEFHLKYSIEHATDGIRVKDILGARNATCVVGPLLLEPNKEETKTISLETAGILDKAGCKICLMADTASRTAWLPVEIGLLLRRGLSEETAFRAVTINAAENLELDHRLGSLEPGKDADIAVFDGHPFSNLSLCRMTMIDGIIYHNTLQ